VAVEYPSPSKAEDDPKCTKNSSFWALLDYLLLGVFSIVLCFDVHGLVMYPLSHGGLGAAGGRLGA
jgi:hypothetical protein